MSLNWRIYCTQRFLFIITIGSTLTLVDSSIINVTKESHRLQLVNFGSSAKIHCSFKIFDDGDLVQWSHGDDGLSEESNYKMEKNETTASLSIKNTTFRDAGNYTCKKFANKRGKWEIQHWMLMVQDGPFFKPITTVMQNESFTAICCVKFSDAVHYVEYLWAIGVSLFITNRSSQSFSPRVPICSNVSITAKRSYHNKILECTITNGLNISSYRRVTVMYPATAVWNFKEESLIVENNTSINITCVADGFPPPRVTLQKYNADLELGWINTNSVPELVRQDDTQILTTFLYHFLTDNLSEKLRCFASNNLSENQGGNGFLVEAFIPARVLILSGSLYSDIGDNVTISCASYGRPIPDVYLQKNVFGKWETLNEVPPMIKNATTNPLQLIWEFHLEVNSADTEVYRCHANNTVDIFHDSSSLSVEISFSFSMFIQEHIQTVASLLIGVLVVIIVIAMTIGQRRNASRYLRPTIRRYGGAIRNSLHFGNDSQPIPNIPDVCQTVAPLPPDTRSIPVADRGIRDELLETYEELQEKDDKEEEQMVNPLLSTEMVNYAVVQKKSTRTNQPRGMKNENDDVTFNQCDESASYSVLRPKT